MKTRDSPSVSNCVDMIMCFVEVGEHFESVERGEGKGAILTLFMMLFIPVHFAVREGGGEGGDQTTTWLSPLSQTFSRPRDQKGACLEGRKGEEGRENHSMSILSL